MRRNAPECRAFYHEALYIIQEFSLVLGVFTETQPTYQLLSTSNSSTHKTTKIHVGTSGG